MTYLTMSQGERLDERKVTLKFLVILCRSAFKGIIERSFLVKLDVVASPVHLKVAYHDKEGNLTAVNNDLEGA